MRRRLPSRCWRSWARSQVDVRPPVAFPNSALHACRSLNLGHVLILAPAIQTGGGTPPLALTTGAEATRPAPRRKDLKGATTWPQSRS